MRVSTMLGWTIATLYILIVCGQPVKTSHSGSVVGNLCRRAEIPADRPRGSNRVSSDNWDPVYKLSVSTDEQNDYTVSVKLGSRFLPFSDATISAETNGSCGVGEFHYNDSDFYRVVQPHLDCPLLLTTNRKSVMQRLPPLRWKGPSCGCVHFRAMIIEASTVYYAEQANKAEGPLAITICSPQAGLTKKELTVEERTELLCQVTERNTGLSIIQRPRFLHNHRLEPRYMNTHALDLALSARRHDISACCTKRGAERRECMNDIRRRRVDAFCEDGVPDVPFTMMRASFMRQREESCCWRLAEDRYSCFSTDADLKAGKGSADFSLDETDPLNDLADYDEELRILEKELGTTFVPRAVTEKPSLPSPSTTIPTTTTTTTTTASTITTTPSPVTPPLQSPGRSPQFPSQRIWMQGQGAEEGGQNGRLGKMARGGSWGFGKPSVEEPSMVSREIREQQGGSSIEKTFSGLKRRMWKLSLKTLCCQAGMGAASAAYGNFDAVWTQCLHSAAKFLADRAVRHGHKLCSSQYHRCCMEMAISIPPEVVTLAPDSASSREWDRDRHLIHSLYMPPYARILPRKNLTAPQRYADLSRSQGRSSAERQRGIKATRFPLTTLSLAARKSLLTDESETDEEPEIKRRKMPRRFHSRERGSSRARQVSALDEELALRRQRRLRKLNSRERKKLGRRSRERLDVDDDELEENPMLMKKRRRKPNSRGRSKERRNRQGQMRRRNPSPVPEQTEQEVLHKDSLANTTQPSVLNGASNLPTTPKTAKSDTSTEVQKRKRRLQLEAEQFKRLFAEIAEDVEEEDDGTISEEADNGSEENDDTLGLTEQEIGNSFDNEDDDDDEDDEDDDDEEFDDGNEDIVNDVDFEKTNTNVNTSNITNPERPNKGRQNSSHKSVGQSADESKLQSLQTTSQKTTDEEKESKPSVEESKLAQTSPAPRRQRISQETMNTSSRRRNRLLRLRLKGGLSEDDAHSGGRSSRRRRKHPQGRKRMRNLRHQKRRLRDRERRRELAEALEED